MLLPHWHHGWLSQRSKGRRDVPQLFVRNHRAYIIRCCTGSCTDYYDNNKDDNDEHYDGG